MNAVKRFYPIAVSVFVLAALTTLVDISDLLKRLTSIEVTVLATVLAIHLLQVGVVALRWRLVLGGIGARIPYPIVIRYQFMALSAGLFMPASIGTGAVQAVLANDHVPVSKAVNSAIIDRYIAAISLVLTTLCMMPFATFILADFSEANAALALAAPLLAVVLSLAILSAIARSRYRFVTHIRKFLDDFRAIGLRAGRMANLFLTSVGGLLLYIAAFFILARAQEVDIAFVDLIILMPPVMLAAAMPISYGGWGVREGALAATLSLVDVPAVDAIALSVQQGIIALIPGILGGVLWAGRSISNARQLADSIDAYSPRPFSEQRAAPPDDD